MSTMHAELRVTAGRDGAAEALPRGARAFADPRRVVRGWYVLARAGGVKRRPMGVDLLGRRVVVWRDGEGVAHAVDAVCPHLGADLSLGAVTPAGLRCPFHHWTFDGDGRCTDAPCEARTPDRRTRAYPVIERHGLLWLHNGGGPRYDVPDLPPGDPAGHYRRVIVPSLHLNCHPHLAIANGLDATHLDKLHGLRFTAEPRLREVDAYRLELTIRGRPAKRWIRAVTRTGRRDVEATFTTVGPSIAWLTFEQPLRFHVLFTARPDALGQTDTQTVIYLPRGLGLRAARAAATLLLVLHADRAVLNTLRFHRGFTDADAAQRRFAELVDAMEVEP